MNDVVAFVREHLDADAALSVAALGEPDDDAYLAVEARAKSFYGPGIGPVEGRWAKPGGRMQRPVVDATGEVRPAALYAVGEAGPDAWVALVGDSRDLDAMFVAAALLVRRTEDGPRVTGRAAIDPFTDDIVFEEAGGEAVPARPSGQIEVHREPVSERHAAFLRAWAAGS
jgi:hypothetical protein